LAGRSGRSSGVFVVHKHDLDGLKRGIACWYARVEQSLEDCLRNSHDYYLCTT
jgi:hypothetical protein